LSSDASNVVPERGIPVTKMSGMRLIPTLTPLMMDKAVRIITQLRVEIFPNDYLGS
jgi:hypothetical protein